MADVESEIEAEGVAIVWVVQQATFGQAGEYADCAEFNDRVSGSNAGFCVGDGDTSPTSEAFNDSVFTEGRGFDILVDRSTMEIVFTTSHGTPTGNENITGAELLAEIRTFTQ